MLIFVLVYIGVTAINKQSKNISLEESELSQYSVIQKDEKTLYVDLDKDDDILFESSKKGKDAVFEMFDKNFKLSDGSILFPKDLKNEIQVKRNSKDQENNKDHIFFDQKVGDVRIVGGEIVAHIKDQNKIYALTGKVLFDKSYSPSRISDDEAREKAVQKAKEEVDKSEFIVTIHPKAIVNLKLLGISDDSTNYLTAPVQIDSDSEDFSKIYYVELQEGKIVNEEPLLFDAMNRQIHNCSLGGSCDPRYSPAPPVSRSEGGAAIGDVEVDGLYDLMGQIYNYYKDSFGRDSYNNSGGALVVYANGPPNNASWWNSPINKMVFAAGFSKRDVVGHEFTHGIVNYSANFSACGTCEQSGALNEGMGDIFGTALDNNWTMGEETSIGVIRDLSDPTAPVYESGPDRLFSDKFVCSPASYGAIIHKNSLVLGKAFYLMTDGGNFNGCTIQGIGRTRSHKVIYNALTNYMSSSTNFKSAYTAIIRACNDLYGSDPGICEQVTKAMQATEMDQQPDGTQIGPKCSGGTPQTPTCSGGASGPGITITPFPTASSGGGSTPGSYKVSGKVYIDVNNSGTFDSGDTPYKDADLELTDGPKTGSATTNTSGDYVLSGYPSGLYTITLSILGSKKEEKPLVLGPDSTMDFRIFSSLTEPTIVPGPTIKLDPTIGGAVKPTPTPVPYICEYDPSCAAQKKNLQLCKLICHPK